MSQPVTNYMGGTSYKPDPVQRLRLMLSSSIFGEPKYYDTPTTGELPVILNDHVVVTDNDVTRAIDEALSHDFEKTVALIPMLRNKYLMRKNPQILSVRSTLHPDRQKYTSTHGKDLSSKITEGISRPDDISIQLEYLDHLKKKVTGIMKRIWSKKIESFNKYQMMKYGKTLIDPIRLSHPKGPLVGELLQKGLIHADEETTWDRLKSQGKSWEEIITHFTKDDRLNMPHMALLRNIRSIGNDATNEQLVLCLSTLLSGVIGGKQFPFRYYSAYKQTGTITDPVRRKQVEDTLDLCINKALENVPKLRGNTVSLSDNSGSSWGAGPSEYSTMKVAEIGNLASIMAVKVSEKGKVVIFGDTFKELYPGDNVLQDVMRLTSMSQDVGSSTEGGIWLYLDRAIRDKEHIDNLFIYSDMQAGTGGLYGVELGSYGIVDNSSSYKYIDVLAMIERYRREVNPYMNVFSIQIAGYDNSLVPYHIYRGAVVSGWTGGELTFASEIISIWDEVDKALAQ